MLTLSAGRMVEVTGGELVSGSADAMVNGVCTDSRAVQAGCAFVAFAGERADGHAYVADALRAGARAALVTRYDDAVSAAVEQSGRHQAAVVLVRDATSAVVALAKYHRARW
jgi:UDP-N-acetylmuramoyl-tripeptide--D-alanyl-D-alanine ligase